MLLSRLFRFLRDAKTSHVFLLEILAVFIGITASLFIDNWRQERADYEVLDNLLQDTHYNALQDSTMIRRIMLFNGASLESSLELAYRDIGEMSDDVVLRHFQYATAEHWRLDMQPGYGRLLNTSLAIPFHNTMAELDWHFRNLGVEIDDFNRRHTQVSVAARELLTEVGRSAGINAAFLAALTGEAAQQASDLLATVTGYEGFDADMNDAAKLREALQSEAAQDLLRELIGYRVNQQAVLINAGDSARSIVRSIRKYDPDITLPIGVMGIAGDGTGRGWDMSVPMQVSPDDPNLWAAEISLVNGEIKFRADDDWSSDWGTPALPQNTSSEAMAASPFSYSGDLATAFPRGQAEFKGLNIPVEAGHYRVTFNTQTFDYAFERLDD